MQHNALTIGRNGSEKIGGLSADLLFNTEGQSLTLVYVDGTKGWKNVQTQMKEQVTGSPFITATGGTETNVVILKFIHLQVPGTFTVHLLLLVVQIM